jgi:hypothetical protein
MNAPIQISLADPLAVGSESFEGRSDGKSAFCVGVFPWISFQYATDGGLFIE